MLDDFDLDIPEEDLDDFLADDGDDDSGDGGGFSLGNFNLGGGDNRRFMMIAGGIGGFIIISLICLALILPRLGGGDDTAAQTQAAEAAQTQTQGAIVAPSATKTSTHTASPSASTSTATRTPTSTTPAIISATDTPEGGPTENPITATVQALLTQAALAQTQAALVTLTVTPTPTPASLPDSGFLDDYGPVGLFTLTAVLLLVIFMARKLRAANEHG